MKLDYDLIKEILEEVEEKGNGLSKNVIRPENYLGYSGGMEIYLKRRYHYKIIFEIGLVIGDVKDIEVSDDKMKTVSFYYIDLTHKGHEVLEAMRNDTLWNTIKGNVKKAGITGLKQIPALALAAFMAV